MPIILDRLIKTIIQMQKSLKLHSLVQLEGLILFCFKKRSELAEGRRSTLSTWLLAYLGPRAQRVLNKLTLPGCKFDRNTESTVDFNS